MLLVLCGSINSPVYALTPPTDDLNLPPNYDEVVRDLIVYLGKDRGSAEDASRKLVSLGKRSVPVLDDMLHRALRKDVAKEAVNQQIAYYSLWSLAHIRAPEAAATLVPFLDDAAQPMEYRLLAVNGVSLEKSDEAVVSLRKLAADTNVPDLRMPALQQLSLMPAHWVKSELLFVKALDDSDSQIRLLAAKTCSYTRIYRSAVPKLIELAGKESDSAVLGQVLNSLQRMRAKAAVPTLYKLCTNEKSSPAVQKQTMYVLRDLTGISFKDAASMSTWWDKAGKEMYEAMEQALLAAPPLPAEADLTKGAGGTTAGAPVSKPPVTTDDLSPRGPARQPQQPVQVGTLGAIGGTEPVPEGQPLPKIEHTERRRNIEELDPKAPPKAGTGAPVPPESPPKP